MATSPSNLPVPLREDAKDMTWICACGKVEIEVNKLNIVGGCYCDDCVNRVRIGQKKNGYNPHYNNFWCKHGGWGQGNVFDKDLKITKGEELLRGFRCALKNSGTEFRNQETRSLTVFASCCNTIVLQLMNAHAGMSELNNLRRLKGWKAPFEIQEDYKETDPSCPPPTVACAKWTGGKFPSGAPAQASMGDGIQKKPYGPPGKSYPGGCPFFCFVICPMMCSNRELDTVICGATVGKRHCCCGPCMSNCWAPLDVCCLRRCHHFSPALTLPKAGVATFNGHPIEFFENDEYMVWPFHGTPLADQIDPNPNAEGGLGQSSTPLIGTPRSESEGKPLMATEATS